MSAPSAPPKKKLPLAKLGALALIALIVAAVVLQVVGWKTALDEGKRLFAAGLNLVASAGPVVFFGAMATMPAMGVPMAPFAIAAGLVFRESLGIGGVIVAGFAALSFNIALTYWLARRWLRPLLTRWLARFGYNLPQVDRGDMTDLIVLLRVTPGPPFFVQNYLLGLADAPFARYLGLSCAIQGAIMVGFMLLGQALSEGRGKLILTAVLGLAALVVGTHLLRKHMTKKQAAP